MQAVDLKSQITVLVQLQEIDTQIYSLRAEKDAKPKEIQALESAFEQEKLKFSNIEKKSLDLQKQKKDFELDLGSKEEAVKRLQTQLYSLKTNKEYQVMLKQIDDAKADISVVEDKVLQVLDQVDKVKAEMAQEKQRLQEEESKFNTQNKNIQDRIKEIDDNLQGLEVKRKQITPNINPAIIVQYERILTSRDGLAIVSVKDNSCQGCNMLVPPQVINLIKMYERIITCEVCNRILYIIEDEPRPS